jgi:hypothetical protein
MLNPPTNLQQPWLISLDPMTFVVSAFRDDDNLHAEDLHVLADKWTKFLRKRQPGAMAIFCYSIFGRGELAFRNAVEAQAFPNLTFIETLARGGRRHIAAICSTEQVISARAYTAWTQIADIQTEL